MVEKLLELAELLVPYVTQGCFMSTPRISSKGGQDSSDKGS